MDFKDSVNNIKSLSSLDLSRDECFDKIYAFLCQTILPYNIITLKRNSYLFRARPIKHDLNTLTKSYMSYNPDSKKILEFGRANKPYQPMFYGSNQSVTAVFETSSLIRDNKTENKVEELVLGRWFVKRDIQLLGVISNDKAIKDCFEIRKLHKSMPNEINVQPEAKWIDKYISDIFAENVKGDTNKYKLSAAIYNYFQDKLGSEVEGIAYPSVSFEYSDTNVALQPSCVESSLILDMLGGYKIDFNLNPVQINQIFLGDIQSFQLMNLFL